MKPRQPSRKRERCQFLSDVVGASRSLRHVSRRRVFHMGATNLGCRECGAAYELDARYVCSRCFGPLEVVYDHSALTGDVAGAAAPDPGRPAEHLALRRLPAARRRPAGPVGRASSRAGLPAGCTPLVRADRLAERLGLGEVWVKNDAANPTHSFKDRVVSVAAARARELGFEVLACASTGNLANAVAAHAAALGPRDLRLHPVRPRGAEDPRDRRLRDEPRRGPRQLRRRQPALHRALGRARLGVRQRQPAPVLRRGLQDDRLRDRRAARLGARPTAIVAPDRLGLAVHEDRQGLRGVARARPRRAATLPTMQRRAGRRLLAGRAGLRRRPRRLPPGQAGHDRQVAGDRQPGRRPVRARARPHARGGVDRRRHRRRDPRRHPPARRDDRASSPRRPAA